MKLESVPAVINSIKTALQPFVNHSWFLFPFFFCLVAKNRWANRVNLFDPQITPQKHDHFNSFVFISMFPIETMSLLIDKELTLLSTTFITFNLNKNILNIWRNAAWKPSLNVMHLCCSFILVLCPLDNYYRQFETLYNIINRVGLENLCLGCTLFRHMLIEWCEKIFDTTTVWSIPYSAIEKLYAFHFSWFIHFRRYNLYPRSNFVARSL